MIRLHRMIAPIRVIRLIWAATAAAVRVVGPLWVLGPRTLPNDRRRDDASPPQVLAPDPGLAATVVVHRALPHARHEDVRALAVFEDEARLRPQGPREHHPRAAVVAIRVVIRIVENHDPEANAAVIVRAPIRVADVRVAVVAQEPRVVVMLPHIVGHDIVVPLRVALGHDTLGEAGERDVGVAADAAVGDSAVVPVVAPFDRVVGERVGCRDRENIAHAWVVIDVKGLARVGSPDLVVPVTASEVVLPGLAREQGLHPPVRIDAEDRDERVLLGAEVDPDGLTAGIRVVAPAGPDFDAGAIIDGASRLERAVPAGDRQQAK